MVKLSKLGEKRLNDIVREALPGIGFSRAYLWKGSMDEQQVLKALACIRESKYLEDAVDLVYNHAEKGRTSVGYDLKFPDQKEEVYFELRGVMRMGPTWQCMANLYTFDRDGHEVRQLAIDDISLEK